MRTSRLGNTDLHLSALGYGAGALSGGYGDAAQSEANLAVARAIECGTLDLLLGLDLDPSLRPPPLELPSIHCL